MCPAVSRHFGLNSLFSSFRPITIHEYFAARAKNVKISKIIGHLGASAKRALSFLFFSPRSDNKKSLRPPFLGTKVTTGFLYVGVLDWGTVSFVACPKSKATNHPEQIVEMR